MTMRRFAGSPTSLLRSRVLSRIANKGRVCDPTQRKERDEWGTVEQICASSRNALMTGLVLAISAFDVRSSAQTLSHGEQRSYAGFDRNSYPGDRRLQTLRAHFDFTGFWLNNPPGERVNSWAGHRPQLLAAGLGFLVLWNGRLDAEIKRSRRAPEALAKEDATAAIVAAGREGFPNGTIIFLDQEEGGRLLPEQAAYFFAWTERVATSRYRAGAYLSGQPSGDGTGAEGKPLTISTAADVRETVAREHLHPVVFWVAQDACPPAPGCTLKLYEAKPRDSGIADAAVWQYAQSPRRPELTRACAATYAADGNCYAGITKDLFLDLDLADSPDPSRGR